MVAICCFLMILLLQKQFHICPQKHLELFEIITQKEYTCKKMKHKIYKLATSFWLALQGLIMISWTSYLYINEKQQNTEIFVLGCVLLVIAVLFNFKSNVIKKICCGFLLLYSICTAIIGWLLISVASPTREAFWIIILIIIANMIPTAHYCFSQEEK